MSTDPSKIRAKLAKLDKSLDELESQLEPLFAKSLPETLLALDTIQQAKLHTIIPYVVYDLIFVYLKSRGIDPKTHRVVAELERVRQYFDKIKLAEESDQKRKLGVDKEAASRFIKHAIAQAKNTQLIDEPSDAVPVAGPSNDRLPAKLTSKMMARAEYQKKLRELGSEEEDDLNVIDEQADQDEGVMLVDDPPVGMDKGKGRASGEAPPGRKRPRIDPFSGLAISGSTIQKPDSSKKAKLPKSVPPGSTPNNDASQGTSGSTSEEREAKKAAKKAKRKAKQP